MRDWTADPTSNAATAKSVAVRSSTEFAVDCLELDGLTIGDCLSISDVAPMAIYRMIADGSFGPEEIDVMTAAYEAALLDLVAVDRNDPRIREDVARSIITIASLGELDPVTLKERALSAIDRQRTLGDAA